MLAVRIYGIGLLLFLTGLFACTVERSTPDASVPPDKMTVIDKSGGAASGQRLYEENCASCHALSGKGNPVMMQGRAVRFDQAGYQKTLTDDYIQQTIKQGKGMMPAFETTFTDKELDELVKYVRSLTKAS